MRRWCVPGALVSLLVTTLVVAAVAQSKLVVTAKELIARNHQLEVAVGTEQGGRDHV